jgi:hypothetical protein
LRLQSLGDDGAARSKRLAALLTRVLRDAEDTELIEVGTRVMGRLVKAFAGVSSEVVAQQVRDGWMWLVHCCVSCRVSS